MTRFEYDPYPFAVDRTTFTPPIADRNSVPEATVLNTWNPTGTDVVWGCERPELVITETIATHDRRQVQTAAASGPDPAKYANNFRPEGSLFVEIFNPNTPAEPAPGELAVNRTTNTNVGGVRLNQTTASGNDPVWRLAIFDVPKDTSLMIPDGSGYYDPTPDGTGITDLDRLVYFVHESVPTSGALPEATVPNVTFFPSAALEIAPVLPRRYAVVGPGDTNNAAYGPGSLAGTTLFGELPSSDVSDVRRIEIVPSSNPNQIEQVPRLRRWPVTTQVEVISAARGPEPVPIPSTSLSSLDPAPPLSVAVYGNAGYDDDP